MIDWNSKFQQALPYAAFLDKYADPRSSRPRWQRIHEQVALGPDQCTLLSGFTRHMNVLCVFGAWCGDCIQQGPMLQRIAQGASHCIDLRFLDRDEHPDLQAELSICGGKRVPIVVFLSEDFYECSRMGDRTLSTYRVMAANLTGAACPTGLACDGTLQKAQIQEWLDEFERVQLDACASPPACDEDTRIDPAPL